jgi:hypothetical protein
MQPDETLQPLNPAPLPTPPKTVRASYCIRDTMVAYVGDERLLKIEFPLVIRSGHRKGVLEADAAVVFDYRWVGDRYVPGKAPTGH